MELFKITCVTCQAKLSVRNESLIGQIVACPRCDSMVQVERPVGTAAAMPPPPVESAPAQPAPVPEPIVEPVAPVAEPPVAAEDIAQTEPEPSVPVEAPQAGAPIANYKFIAWTLGAFVGGAVVVGAVFFLRGDSAAEAEPATPIVQQQNQVEDSTPVAEPILTEVAEGPLEVEATPDEPVVIPTVEVAELPTAEAPIEVEPAVDSEPEPAAETPKVARRFDPLDFDPESLDLATINGTDNAQKPEPMLDEPPAQDNDVAVAPLPSTLPSVRRDPSQTVTPAVAEEKLTQRFPALTVSKMPLVDFLAFVSRLAAVPVSVAPEELQMAGITARREVSLDTKEVDLNEALRLTLGPLHLEHVVEGPIVRVVRKGGSKLREVKYPLNDLTSSASVEEIATWVEQLVAPTEWQTVGGEGTLQQEESSLKVKQTQRVQYQVLIFLERLRLANKLPPRSRFPVKRLASAPAHAVLAARLEAPTTFTFSRYTALQEIVQHWQVEVGVPVLVDWPALAEVDLWPQTRVACSIENKPWHRALNEVLEPLGLGWRAAAGEMLEITTSQKVQTQPLLELYSLSRSPDSGADRMLAELTEVSSPDAATHELTAIEYDSRANVVFVLQPAASQRQVFDWLVQNHLLSRD
ncbi:MAG: hypothetical protein GXP26_10265 [Planctomycetes bacterium]|nr:hypothetical protein [Planctomycetota bacterium]